MIQKILKIKQLIDANELNFFRACVFTFNYLFSTNLLQIDPIKIYVGSDEISGQVQFELLRKEGLNSTSKVLEIGCGAYNISNKLVEIGANVTLIDISEKAIEIANKNIRDNQAKIKCVVMDAENLKFNNLSFDLIYGSGILHHLSLEKAIMEINRVLKIGGRAIFYEPLGHNIFINMFRFLTPSFRSKDEHPLLIEDIESE